MQKIQPLLSGSLRGRPRRFKHWSGSVLLCLGHHRRAFWRAQNCWLSAAQRTVISRQLPTTEPAQPCNEIDGCLLLMTGRTMVQNRCWRFGLSFTAAARSACSANLPNLPTSQSRLRRPSKSPADSHRLRWSLSADAGCSVPRHLSVPQSPSSPLRIHLATAPNTLRQFGWDVTIGHDHSADCPCALSTRPGCRSLALHAAGADAHEAARRT